MQHGYIFEVSAAAEHEVEAVPLKAMGRFVHEAVAVDAETGIVYETEDRLLALFYRFIPAQHGVLRAGGRLQMLATPRPLPPDTSVLTSRELSTVIGTSDDTYAAIERLRPLFLLARPSGGRDTRLQVFINGVFAGDEGILKTIPVASVESIQRLHATAAFTQFGTLQTGDGVILVRLRR